jgi:hypothetical protein
MALPTTVPLVSIDAAVRSKPFLSSAGNVYIITRIGSDTDAIGVVKATDPTDSFSDLEVDFDLVTGSIIRGLDAIQVGDKIHVAAVVASTAINTVLTYSVFDMETDSWEISGESVVGPYECLAVNDCGNCGIGVRSDGDVIIVYNSEVVANMGSDRQRVSYARREGGSWTVDVSIDEAGAVQWICQGLVVGASDRMHFFLTDTLTSDAYQRTLTSANALETFPSAYNSDVFGDIQNFHTGTSYVSGGTMVRMPITPSTVGDVDSTKCDSADAPTMSQDSDISGSTVVSNSIKLASSFTADGTTLWHTFRSVGDIYVQFNEDDGGWSEPELFEETSGSGIRTNLYTRDGAIVIGMSYGNTYHEYVIDEGGVSGDADFTFGAMTTTSDGDVSVGGTYNKTFVAMTTTSDGDVSLSGTANFTFGAMTTTSEVDVVVVADSDTTFDAMTLTADGTVADPVIIGDADFTFGAMTTTSDGDVAVDADATFTFGAMTTTADADVAVVADANFSYDTMAVSSTGDVSLSGTADFTFGAMTLTADGTVAFDERIGTADFTFGGMTTTADAVNFKTRLYFRIDTNNQSGTYPSDSEATSPLLRDWLVADATTLKLMTLEKGTEETFSVKTGNSDAIATQQVGFMGFWTSPPLDGNQTITNAALNINAAFYQSNVAMNFGDGFTSEVYVWRPSTGAKVGTIHHNVSYSGVAEPTAAFSEQVNHGTATSSTEVSALDGDVIVCELFQVHTQDDATSYQGAFYFDGGTVNINTNDSANSHASFIEFAPAYNFQGLAAVADANFTFGAMTTTSDGDVAVLADADFTFDAMTVTSDGDVAIIVVDGDFSFDAMTTTSDADVFVDADANFTLGAMTTTTEVDVLVDATADLTFGAMTLTTEVDVAVLGTADFTFGAMTLTADGTVSAAPVIVADADFTFGSMTTTTDVDILVEADADFSYAAMTATASGALAIAASATLLMGAMSTASDGDVFIVGESNFTYDAMTVSAAILGEAEMANLDKISLFASDYAPGTINDKLKKLLIANGATGTHIDDLWMSFLGNLGHTGTMNDRLRKFLLAYHAVSDTGQTVDDLWSLVTGPYTP